MKDKRPSVKFSTSYKVYYGFGSILSGSLDSSTRKGLIDKMKSFIKDEKLKEKDIEAITFESIIKTVSAKEVKGKAIQLKKKLTNPYLFGKGIQKKYYQKL